MRQYSGRSRGGRGAITSRAPPSPFPFPLSPFPRFAVRLLSLTRLWHAPASRPLHPGARAASVPHHLHLLQPRARDPSGRRAGGGRAAGGGHGRLPAAGLVSRPLRDLQLRGQPAGAGRLVRRPPGRAAAAGQDHLGGALPRGPAGDLRLPGLVERPQRLVLPDRFDPRRSQPGQHVRLRGGAQARSGHRPLRGAARLAGDERRSGAGPDLPVPQLRRDDRPSDRDFGRVHHRQLRGGQGHLPDAAPRRRRSGEDARPAAR